MTRNPPSTASRCILLVPVLVASAPYRSTMQSPLAPDGIRSLLANPAGLALMDGREFAVQLGGGEPAGQDAVLVGARHFGIGWERRPWSNSGASVDWSKRPWNTGLSESNLLVGFGAPLPGGLSLGATAVRHEVDGSSQGWSADLGALWRPVPRLSLSWLYPDFLRRDPSRDRTNSLGVGIRPFATADLAFSAEVSTPSAPWNRSAWDDPSWEIGAEIRPASWLRLEARMDPLRTATWGFGVAIQVRPNLGFYSSTTPATTGPEFQTAGVRWSSRSRPATSAMDGVLIYRVPPVATEASQATPMPFQRKQGFARIRDDFREMATIRDLKTVVLDLGSGRFSPTQAGVLRRMVLDLRKTGREVRVWAADLDMANLHVMSAADKAAISPEGAVRTRGLAMDVLYFGEFLKRHGVAVQVVKTGPWKSAMEPFEKERMSDPARANLSRILFDLDSMILGGAAEGRRIDPAALVSFVDTGSTLPRAAVAKGLVDTLLLQEDLGKWARGRKLSLPLSGTHDDAWGAGPGIAVVPLEGQIVDKGGDAGMVPWNRSLPADRIARRLDALADDRRVGAVVLRIQSPGGSVAGSERLRRAVERLAKKKPVVASLGSTAASGGYMLALPAARIFSEPEAMVGSIGVFAAKMSVGRLMDSLGIRVERVRTAAHAGALSPWAEFDSLELARMTEYVEDAHVRFADQVMAARKLDSAAFLAVGGGRVFSGARARDMGLVDTLGGLEEAIGWARSKAGIPVERRTEWIDPVSGDGLSVQAQAFARLAAGSEPDWLANWERLVDASRPTIWSQSWDARWE